MLLLLALLIIHLLQYYISIVRPTRKKKLSMAALKGIWPVNLIFWLIYWNSVHSQMIIWANMIRPKLSIKIFSGIQTISKENLIVMMFFRSGFGYGRWLTKRKWKKNICSAKSIGYFDNSSVAINFLFLYQSNVCCWSIYFKKSLRIISKIKIHSSNVRM